jgi:hypothetical protein
MYLQRSLLDHKPREPEPMVRDTPTSSQSTPLQAIEHVEAQLAALCKSALQQKKRLTRAKRDLGDKGKPATVLGALVADLKAMASLPELPDFKHLAEELERERRQLKERLEQGFTNELRRECEGAKLALHVLPDALGVGAFWLQPNLRRETASAWTRHSRCPASYNESAVAVADSTVELVFFALRKTGPASWSFMPW